MIGELCPRADPMRADAETAAVRPGIAAPQRVLEICQSIAAHNADCELGSAAEDSQSCLRHLPPKAQRGPAQDIAARYTAAHPARHSYTADHLAEIPHAPPPLDSAAFAR